MTIRRFVRLALTAGGTLAAACLVLLGPDLFYAIPWPVRKGFGWAAFAGLVAVLGWRLCRVAPGGDRPPSDADAEAGVSPRWPAWAGPALVAGLAGPLLRQPENLGFGDWDWFLAKYEAARRSITAYGQFPWWDPWTRGGFPLAANPQCGVGGVAMPLVLAFGTSVGMRLATLACFLLAFEGVRRLSRSWLGDPVAATLAAAIYALNGGVSVMAVAGYHLSMCYPALPWMLHYTLRLDRRRADGLWLGAWAAFNVLNGIQYFTVYAALIVGAFWSRQLIARLGSRAELTRFLGHSALALGAFLALAGWRLATTGLVYRDFPRAYRSGYDETPWMILVHLLDRAPAGRLAAGPPPYFWETACYVGPVALALAALSLRGGWRWWHTLALLGGWLAAGSVSWYHPSYWLAHFPIFATMHVVPRWRFMALLGVALAAGSVVAAWHRDGRRGRRWLARAALLAVAGDYVAYAREVLPVGFSIAPAEASFPGPELPRGVIVQVPDWPGFAAVARGYGVIYGYEPLMGYDRRAASARRFRGAPSYRGEAWTTRGPARVVAWSPNRVVLEAEPGAEVMINQNPGSWWWANGRPAFPGLRAAEKDRPFVARADSRGRLVLEIRPRGLMFGLGLHLAGGLILAATWAWLGRSGHRGVGPGAAAVVKT